MATGVPKPPSLPQSKPPIFVLLFCTASLPTEIIEDLLYQSQRTVDGYNVWSLVRTPDSGSLEAPTHVPIKPFSTGFAFASIGSLGEFVTKKIPDETHPDLKWFSKDMFGILDKRSLDDRTVVLVKRYTSILEEDAENEEGATVEWKELRVNFSGASNAAVILDIKPWLYLDEMATKEHFDEHGVYLVPFVEMKSEEQLKELPTP